jgi:hypothetical protein
MQSNWLKVAALALTALCLLGLFATEIADTDFWWHLKTGQYLVERRSLPVPDPFAYTTAYTAAMRAPADAGEERVRRFNLTHEWLAQVGIYAAYAAGGFPAVVLVRALLLAGVCGLAGFLSGRLSGNFYAGIAAAFATASVAVEFAADRPALVTFLLVAVFVCLLELGFAVWALPPLALLWANCHSGFFLGWLVLAAYCIEKRRLWLVAVCSIAVSGLNPNGFGVLSTLLAYRKSPMTADLLEWRPPLLWGPPYGFDLLFYGIVVVLALYWRKVRVAHWILFAAFAGASWIAFRNILLMGFLAPVLIAAYFPRRMPRFFEKRISRLVAWVVPLALLAGLVIGMTQGRFFQLRAADWTTPAGAADYLLANHAIFNTYEQGGYLIWRLWPQHRVFIDGRALSEPVYRDYRQILFNDGSAADQVAGPRAGLLDQYGVQVVVMNTLDYASGALYPLALALANPAGSDWQLVYNDAQAVVFVRHPPAGTQVLANQFGRILKHLNTECEGYIEHSPDNALCAHTLADFWIRNQAAGPARRMLRLYLEHAPKPDPQAERALQALGGAAAPAK